MANTEKKIKICALTTISKSMDWFVVDSMRNLANNGYDITLISNMDEEFIQRNSDYAKCIDLKMSRGINIKNLLRSVKQLRKIFNDEQFDALYYLTPNAAMYASVAGKKAGIKVRMYHQCGIRYVAFSGIKRKIFKFIEKLTCKKSTHIKAVSPLNMQFAIDERLCRKEKISVIGIGGTIGVDLNECKSFNHEVTKKDYREKYGIPNDAFVYGYVGRINADKGINELITAFKMIESNQTDSYLCLVGMIDDANPISEENLKYAEEHPRIVMTGNVAPNEVYRHMAMFDVLTHPTYREGFGKVLQEAMGMSIPIITTNVPGPSEVIENNVSGILCNAQDSDDLRKKMSLLYADQHLRASFAKAGLERAEKYFDRPIMLANILETFDEILKA